MENLISLDESKCSLLLLPPEIRYMIWKYTLPGPRYVEIRSLPESKKSESCNEFPFESWEPFCRELAPIGFFICRESRAVVLETYERFRGPGIRSATIYFDFSKDILVISQKRYYLHSRSRSRGAFDSYDTLEFLDRDIIFKLRHLIVDRIFFDRIRVENFKNLETFSLGVGVYLGSYDDCELLSAGSKLDVVGFNNHRELEGTEEQKVTADVAHRRLLNAEVRRKISGVHEWLGYIQRIEIGDWKPRVVVVGQCILSEHPGLEWEFFGRFWYCSVDTEVMIPERDERYEGACESGECIYSGKVIETPTFRYYYNSLHFPCCMNNFVALDLPEAT